MTNGHDIGREEIIGICTYCKKPIKNKHRFYEGDKEGYVHLNCTKCRTDKFKQKMMDEIKRDDEYRKRVGYD